MSSPPEFNPSSMRLSPGSWPFHALLFASHLQKALAALEHAGVPALAFKGPALAAMACGSLAAREYRDLDVYVPPGHVARACDTLRALGYEYQRPSGARLQPSDYELTLENRAGIQIDLHWRFSPPYLWDFDDAGALARSVLVRLTPDSAPVRTLAPEDHLLYSAIHAAKDCFADPRQIRDIAALLASAPVRWQELLARARRARAVRPLAVALTLAQDLHAAPVPPEALLAAPPALVQAAARNLRAARPVTMDSFRGALFHIRLTPGPAAKLRTFKRRLFHPNQADTDWLPLPRALAFLYPLLRPVRLVLQYGILRRKPGESSFQRPA